MEWKQIKGFENYYEVSSDGRIRTIPREVKIGKNVRTIPQKELKPQRDKDGYFQVCLCKNNKKITKKIHRLVAESFLENPNNFKVINHKDENKQNNDVVNLEWCTPKYNTNYGTAQIKKGQKRRKPILCTDRQGNHIYFDSLIKAEKLTGINHGNISMCLSGKRKSAGGYTWNLNQ